MNPSEHEGIAATSCPVKERWNRIEGLCPATYLLPMCRILQPAVKAFLNCPRHIQPGKKFKKRGRNNKASVTVRGLKKFALYFVASVNPGGALHCLHKCLQAFSTQP